jgi:AcrR family transcriptional regulator
MREGPGGVTVRAVATEAGVAPMGVYNRFGSKDGLIEALLIRGFHGLAAAILAHEGETDAITRLWMAGVRYREFALSHRSHYALMFGQPPGKGGDLSGEGGSGLSAELGTTSDSAFEALVDHVATMMAIGCFAEEDPVLAAQQIWSAVHGAVSLEMADRLAFADPETSYRHLLQMLFRGFAAPGRLTFPTPAGPPEKTL